MATRRRAVALGIAAAVLASGAALSPVLSATPAAHASTRTAHAAAKIATHKKPKRSLLSGVFAGSGPHPDHSFAHWRGAAITSATDFAPNFGVWGPLESSIGIDQEWGHNSNIHLTLSVPLQVGTGNTLRQAARGENDGHFKKMARNMVKGGLGHSTLRLGWEFNAPFYPWAVTTTADGVLYAKAWRSVVRAIRSVKGAHFTFDWCVLADGFTTGLKQAYPGNKYVDYIGSDVYDWNLKGHAQTPASRWHSIVSDPAGLRWQAAFARSHHKPLSAPEWGLVDDIFDHSLSGNDDPTFVRDIHHWFDTHDYAYQNYFNEDNSSEGVRSAIFPGEGLFPKAAKEYRRLFS